MAEDTSKKNPLLHDEQKATPPVEPKKADTATTTKPTTAKAAAAPTRGEATIQGQLVSDAENTRRILEKRPKVRFMIPLGINEKPGAYDEAYINGYRYTIKKGVFVDIPDRVADLLAQKYQIEMEVGKDMRLDRATDVSEALA